MSLAPLVYSLGLNALTEEKRGPIVTRSDMIQVVADAAGISKVAAAKAIDSVFTAISESLKQDQDVRVTGFGTFAVTHRPARTVRSPRTGEKIQVAASRTPKFRPGKALKDLMC